MADFLVSDAFYRSYFTFERFIEQSLYAFLFVLPVLLFFGVNARQLSRWWRAYRRKTRQEQERVRELKETLDAATRQEEQQRARVELNKLIRKNILAALFSIAALAGSWVAFEKFADFMHAERLQSTEELLRLWDAQLLQLKRNPTKLSVLQQENRDEGESHPVKEEDSNPSERLRKAENQLAIAKEKLELLQARGRDWPYCAQIFQAYVHEKRYEGYHESYLLTGAIMQYEACMLEKGAYIR